MEALRPFRKEGRKGSILATVMGIRKKKDEEASKDVTNQNAAIVCGFSSTSFFDVSQSEGTDLPYMRQASDNPGKNLERLAAFVQSRGITLVYNANILLILARKDTSCTEVGRSRVHPRAASAYGTHREVQELEPMMNEHGKSDRLVVPKKSPNKSGQPAAEEMEGRGLAKGILGQQNAPRTQSRISAPSALEQILQTAKSNKDVKFTALMHHIYRIDTLRFAYLQLKRQAAAGVDGETWRHYGEALEANLQNLSHRLKRGAYRAKPVRRVYIPKADGRQRPLGVTRLRTSLSSERRWRY
jgi:hypothetical protein